MLLNMTVMDATSLFLYKNDIKARNIVRLVMPVSLKSDYAQVVVTLPDS